MGKDDIGLAALDLGAEPGGNSGQEPQEARLDRMEDKLDAVIATVAGLVPSGHAEAQRREADKLDRPSQVAELVAAELSRRDKERADREQAEAEKSERAQTGERLARLEEKPPAPPERRATRFMWGSADR
jgi:hypothetical protein